MRPKQFSKCLFAEKSIQKSKLVTLSQSAYLLTVNLCLQESTIKTFGSSAIDDFERCVAELPQTLCAPFREQAGQLETRLIMIYKMAAACAKEEDDLNKVATVWGIMVDVCDDALKSLSKLDQVHPNCGAADYYDRVLDLRNKCLRLQKMHA